MITQKDVGKLEKLQQGRDQLATKMSAKIIFEVKEKSHQISY
jgi:hypothetical protein